MQNLLTKTYKAYTTLGLLAAIMLLTANNFSMQQEIAMKKMGYLIRSQNTTNPVTQRLFEIIETKKTNLALAADVTSKEELLNLVDKVGPEICFLKMHIDIIEDFDQNFIEQLKALSRKHNFLIVEDRKFADIGAVVQGQYKGGIFKIAEWADIVIAHVISGPDIIKALQEAAQEQVQKGNQRGLLILAQMSSSGNLIDDRYTAEVVNMANKFKNFVIGFIAQKSLSDDADFITCTPGVNIAQTKDNLGQNYNSPEYVIKAKQSDVIIVGRGICAAKDPQAAAREYRQVAWNAYMERNA